ncbi:hypothetical protein BJF90_16315 [Pseudonocardia sp. CNS-004]|nr:hypothetical protein BJF90_16315 [Pseudonocardia sp. CNS-004]
MTETYRADWEAWRAGWEQWLAQPHNWLSAVAVNWLDDTPRRFDRTAHHRPRRRDQRRHHLPGRAALDIPAPAEDGTVTLDFNRAVNLPCAFGDFFPICPTPPATNRYPFRIEAGEKTPGGAAPDR